MSGGFFASTIGRMDEELPAEVRTYVDALVAEVDPAFSVELDPERFVPLELFASGAERLADYWEHGEGAAKVRWTTNGAMKRCIRLNRGHMRDPGGYCAKRHKAVTGQWPTEGGKAGIPS